MIIAVPFGPVSREVANAAPANSEDALAAGGASMREIASAPIRARLERGSRGAELRQSPRERIADYR